MTADPIILRIENLRKNYGAVAALQGISGSA
jgi:ABC-type sugar transport system ATPase subunit